MQIPDLHLTLLDTTDTFVIALVQCILMLVFVFGGMKIAHIRRINVAKSESSTIIIAGIYSLMGLLIAFIFGMAGTRFDARKKVIVEEANAIGTAVLRADMYPDSIRTLFRDDFKNYVDARIDYFNAGVHIDKIIASVDKSNFYSDRLWARASGLALNSYFLPSTNQMIPALNQMFDIANERMQGEIYKLPDPIVYMILVCLMIAAFIYGYSAGGKVSVDWNLAICFCVLSSLVIYFIIDLDRPRRGLINLNDTQVAITNLKSMFK